MIGHNVLEVIAGTPNCRAVQIVDKLDMDAEEVLASIKALIQVGDVESSEGKAPNGLPCTVYNVSERFKATATYASLVAKSTAANFAAPGLNRVERAIEWVRQHGTATSAELHAVMGLDDNEAPSKVLTSALTTKRLVKDGKNWTLGPGPGGEVSAPSPACAPKVDVVVTPRFLPPAPSAPPAEAFADQPQSAASRVFADMAADPAPKVTRVRNAKPREKGEEPAPPVIVEPVQPARPAVPAVELDQIVVALHPSIESQPDPAPEPVYRCALWSDGVLEVQRNGLTVAEMPQAAAESLASFLASLAASTKEAA